MKHRNYHDCRDEQGRFRKLYFPVITPSKFDVGDKVWVAHPEWHNAREAYVTGVQRHQNDNLVPIISYNLVERFGGTEMLRYENMHERYVFATELEALKKLMKDIIPCEKHSLNYKLRCIKQTESSYKERIKDLEREKRKARRQK